MKQKQIENKSSQQSTNGQEPNRSSQNIPSISEISVAEANTPWIEGVASTKIVCTTPKNRIELPFNTESGFCTIGQSLIHIVKCKTEWSRFSISADKCLVCKAERQAIIDDINARLGNELETEKPVRDTHLPAKKHEVKPRKPDGKKVETNKQHKDTVEKNSSLAGSKSTTQPPSMIPKQTYSHMHARSHLLAGTPSRNQSLHHPADLVRSKIKGQSSTNVRRKAKGSGLPNADGSKDFLVDLTRSGSKELLSTKITYDEWEKIKELTLEALYDVSPNIDKLYSQYVQLRRVRMASAEMSSTCNEAQVLMDSTVAQLYQSMTDVCRENMTLNKMQDTDIEPLNALIQAVHKLRQQLQQFNIYDRDNIIKRAETKIKERMRKCIAVATKTKNKELLTDLIIVIKNNPALKCNDLMETAKRLVQGINYDKFVSKHTTRLQQRDNPKAKSGKEAEKLKEELQKITNEISEIDEQTFEKEIDVKVVTRLIESLDQNLMRSTKTTNFHIHQALELYFKIVRGVIRKTIHAKSGGDDINKLRKVLKNTGKSLPLRFKTLEICQMIDTFQTLKMSVHKNRELGDDQAAQKQLHILQETVKQLNPFLKTPEVSKFVPEKLLETLEAQAKELGGQTK